VRSGRLWPAWGKGNKRVYSVDYFRNQPVGGFGIVRSDEVPSRVSGSPARSARSVFRGKHDGQNPDGLARFAWVVAALRHGFLFRLSDPNGGAKEGRSAAKARMSGACWGDCPPKAQPVGGGGEPGSDIDSKLRRLIVATEAHLKACLVRLAAAAPVAALSTPAVAQWIDYPAPGVPREHTLP